MKVETNQTAGAASAEDVQSKKDLELRKACREFESVFVAQLLARMRATVPKSELFGSREKEEMFQSMLDQEIAKEISLSGSLGLGDVIYAQLRAKSPKVSAKPDET